MKDTLKSTELIPSDSVKLNEILGKLPDMSRLVGDLVVPEVPIFNTNNLILDNSNIDEVMREIREQKEDEIRDRKKAIELQKIRNELLVQNNQLLQNIDGNTLAVIDKFDKLISSQYATEAIQSEMLEIMRESDKDNSYWDNIKKQLAPILIEKGADYLIAFIAMAIKYSFSAGIE